MRQKLICAQTEGPETLAHKIPLKTGHRRARLVPFMVTPPAQVTRPGAKFAPFAAKVRIFYRLSTAGTKHAVKHAQKPRSMSLAKLKKAVAVLVHPSTARQSPPPAAHSLEAADYERRMIKLYLANIGAHWEQPEKPAVQNHS